VAVFAVVGGLRVTSSSQGVQEGGVNGVLPAPVRPAPVPAAGQRKPARATIAAHPNAHATSARPSHRARSVHVVSKPVAHPVTTTHKPSGSSWHPVVNAPAHNAKPPVTTPPVPPVAAPPSSNSSGAAPLSLTGLSTVGVPALVDQQTLSTADATPTYFSRFIATTTDGPFALKQTVQQSVAAEPSVNIHVTLPVLGQAVPTALIGSTTSTVALPGGSTLVNQQLSLVVAPQALPAGTQSASIVPTTVKVQMVVAPDGQNIASETVNVQDAPTSLPSTNVVGTSTPAAPTSPVAPSAGGVGAVASDDASKGVVGDTVMGRPENTFGVV